MTRKRKKQPDSAPNGSEATRTTRDREAMRDAFAGVKPLRGGKKRVMPNRDARPTRPDPLAQARLAQRPRLSVHRDLDDTVVGQRANTHSSVVDTLGGHRLDIEAECDLHGMTTAEADRAVVRFLRQSHESGKRWVLVIVGKGLHSPDGKATLRDHVIQALSRGTPARYVLAFRTAPRRHGGAGALTVRLVDRL